MKPSVVILAAGQSSRMGMLKALLPLPMLPGGKNAPALRGIVQLYRSAGVDDIVVVSGFHADRVEAAAAELGVSVVRNPAPEQGMFSSVQTGLAALAHRGLKGAFFVHPVDVPLVRPLTILALLDAAAEDAADMAATRAVSGTTVQAHVLVPVFAEQEGHPPLVPACYADGILAYKGEGGLRGALEGLPHRHVPVPDSLMLEDMDTPDDYARLKGLAQDIGILSPLEAEALLALHNVPEKGVRHGRAVGAVAACLAEALAHARETAGLSAGLDPRLAMTGGLLHDICKGQPKHERAAGTFLQGQGLPKLADLVRDHRDLTLPESEPVTERELVYLADKYCYGGSFVPLERRFGLKLEIYAENPDACEGIRGRLGRAQALEERLAQETGTPPGLLALRALTGHCGGKGEKQA